MRLPRRSLLAAPLLLATPPLATGARAMTMAMLEPGRNSELGFTPLPLERLAFRAAGVSGAIALPAQRSRLVTVLPIAARQVAVVAFGADPPGAPARLDLAAFIGWDGFRLRVLALEVLDWRDGRGGTLDSRILATGDRTGFSIIRDAAAPRGTRLWRREHWTDMLAWQAGAPLADDPPRPPLAGTWQAALAPRRAAVAARLATPCQDIADDLIRLLAPASLPTG